MSEWFTSTGEELGGKQGLVTEILCELPPKPTQRIAEVLHGRQTSIAVKQNELHDDDIRTFPPLVKGEEATSRKRRVLALRTAAAKLERAFEAFGRERDHEDFQRLWDDFLAHHTPQRLLSAPQAPAPCIPAAAATVSAVAAPAPPTAHAEGPRGAIPTLLLSTNGASPADRLDLYGAFASYLREQKGAYVALLRPEDLAGGVGGCFGAALAQLSGLAEAASAEDVMALVSWYEHETGRSRTALPAATTTTNALQPLATTATATIAATPAKGAKTPGKAGGRAAKTPSAKTPAAKTPGRGGRGGAASAAAGGGGGVEGQAGGPEEDPSGKENAGGGEAAGGGLEGTVATRLRARGRGLAGQQAAAAAAEAEARAAREAAAAAAAARNACRHVVLLVEGVGRLADRSVLRSLLAALHGERHRLPLVLVLGLSSPAALYGGKLPADVAGLLQLSAAELAPHPHQLHRLFQHVLLAPPAVPTAPAVAAANAAATSATASKSSTAAAAAASSAAASAAAGALLLLDGGCMRELLLQSRLLEPSLASLQAALLEAHEQHFRREPLAPLALLPLLQRAEEVAEEAAAAAAAAARRGRKRAGDDSSSSDEDSDSSGEGDGKKSGGRGKGNRPSSPSSSSSSSYVSVASKEDEGMEVQGAEDAATSGDAGGGGGAAGSSRPGGVAAATAMDDAWLERRVRQHRERLTAAVAELPAEVVKAAAAAVKTAAAASGAAAAAPSGRTTAAEATAVVCDAVTEAFSALSSWRLGLQWLAVLAEGTGAPKQMGGQRYSLPALYIAAASPRFWTSSVAAAAAAIAAAGAAAGGLRAPPAAASLSLGEILIGGVLGPAPSAAAAGAAGSSAAGGAGGASRAALRNLSEEDLELLLGDLSALAREALLRGWMPSAGVMRASRGLEELRRRHRLERAAQQQQQQQAGGVEGDDTSPVRRRLAAQGLTSPPTAVKMQSMLERLGGLNPIPAPKLLQPNDDSSNPQPQQQQQQPAATGAAAGRRGAAAAAGSGSGGAHAAALKLPSSGMTQTKRQRDQALLAAVQQQRAAAAAAGSAAAAGAGAGSGSGGACSSAAAGSGSLAEAAVEVLWGALRELLGACPFRLPGASVFTFRDAPGLQRRLVGAPSLALHTALAQPELVLQELVPGVHAGQEDAALAYQLLVGCREGADLRDWLADFCAASGLGRMQDVQDEQEEEPEAPDADAQGDRPMGRSRHSRRRQAPRKRKAAPKQEMVLALDGPQAEAAVDALACRFEQAVRELEAVGLCRFTKRRKGLYVLRTYFPPETVA